MPDDTGQTSTTLAHERTGLAERRTDLADERTTLAANRTRLALERTLMAWIRTAFSLISFGFTIYKAFQYLRDAEASRQVHRLLEPRGFALVMIALGIASLALASVRHRSEMKTLDQQYGPMPPSTAEPVAAIVVGLGILALVLVALRQ